MSLTSYQTAPPCNKSGTRNVARTVGGVKLGKFERTVEANRRALLNEGRQRNVAGLLRVNRVF